MNNREYTTVLDNLSKDHTISEKDRLAFKQLYGFSIIDTEKLLKSDEKAIKEVYEKNGFGTIFSSKKNNTQSRNNFGDFITIIFAIKELIQFIIQFIIQNKESQKNIPQILKNNINTISNNSEKPYKTGILDFITECRFDIETNDDELDELDKKMLLYFRKYDKDLNLISLGKFIEKSFPKEYKDYTDNQQSVQELLNTLFNQKDIETNKKIVDFLYDYFFIRQDMNVYKFIKTCIKLFPNNGDNIKLLKDNILKKEMTNVLANKCTFEKAKFTTCESYDLVPIDPKYPGFFLCDLGDESIKEFKDTFCSESVTKGGYTKLKKKVRHTYNNKIIKTHKNKKTLRKNTQKNICNISNKFYLEFL